ncbi:Outer membrane protein beta-barrel domain-containing protein [Pedobacter terrae]|uniref:Outer membrane protein beta-barrel domain-containing protein n=1 Tax=Pedobacter terrae TaxID=405671 RepID=A0A1G8E5R2_9SPHI|nr:outer membrane beta-barrel protein [Pedobacter terrae]SDH65205.1 Outer membrane protein beta-barrel domain-containing protein [Pedobacter terrae]
MKKQLLVTAMAVGISLCGFAQTKGTNAVSFGVNSTTNKVTVNNYENKVKNNSFTLGYGYFFKDNNKIGLDLTYGRNKNTYNNNMNNDELKSYGGNLSYQRYFPLVKTLFAYAGGKAGYTYGKNNSQSFTTSTQTTSYTSNQYAVGAYGGITWFVSKRFALETSLLSADITYSKTEQNEVNFNSYVTKSEYTSFNLSSQGFINNLGFKIYILF